MKKLTRNTDDKWIAGVCSGLAEYFGVDVTVVRLIVAVGTVFSIGTGIIAYGVAWVLIPERLRQVQVWPADPPTTPNGPQPPSS